MLQREPITRMRTTALLVAAIAVHLLVVMLLAAQLPGQHPHLRADTSLPGIHHLHEDTTPGQPIVDFTPPEVRTLGGPTLLEVLEAPPSIGVPQAVELVQVLATGSTTAAPLAPLAEIPLGRAPPVR